MTWVKDPELFLECNRVKTQFDLKYFVYFFINLLQFPTKPLDKWAQIYLTDRPPDTKPLSESKI